MSEELKNYLGNINYEIEISDIELEKLDLGLNAKSWKELLDYITNLQERIDKAIEILKLCNSKCAKETINILKGDKDE